MKLLQDRRAVIGAGALTAILLGVAIAFGLGGPKKTVDAPPPPAAKGGLQIDFAEAPEVGPERSLRCFVDGQFVGLATLAACARKNGVSAQALDVGLDESGALIAAETASMAPPPTLPPLEGAIALSPEVAPRPEPQQPTPVSQPVAECLRFIGGEWRRVGDLALGACVQTLYDGRCERPGGAQYGRHGETTLRLVPGRVEQSPDNSRFSTLVEQGRGCSVPLIR